MLNAAQALTRGASSRLYGLIVAAIETGCRLGELLAWQWADVDLDRREARVRGKHTKDDETRRLPISARLAAVLEMAKTDVLGQLYPPTAFVFARPWSRTAMGEEREAEPRITRGPAIDRLRFRDLRHEAGSRWLEASWLIHHVKECWDTRTSVKPTRT